MPVDINDHYDNKASIKVLDKGYVRYIEHMGSDESFVEAARMSTGKGFLGWYWEEDTYADCICTACETQLLYSTLPEFEDDHEDWKGTRMCTNCWGADVAVIEGVEGDFPGVLGEREQVERQLLGRKGQRRDLGMLEYLYSNRHSTPFEMGDIVVEVKAPIEVFRQWHRHRTQSYNEFSARYSRMPDEHYVPELSRIKYQASANKQSSAGPLPPEQARAVAGLIQQEQMLVYKDYEAFLEMGVAKEVARINTPVSRYSKMRAKANVRNWLAFLNLRMDLHAQEEIRAYANAVAAIVKALFPRTFDLFLEWDFLGERFSKSEMNVLRALVSTVDPLVVKAVAAQFNLTERSIAKMISKVTTNKEGLYKEVLEKL